MGLFFIWMIASIAISAYMAHSQQPFLAWLFVLIGVVLGFISLGKAVHQRWDGMLIDKFNRISLGQFQLICWTILLIGSLLSFGLINLVKAGLDVEKLAFALDLKIDEKIWGLLGLPALSAVAAAVIKEERDSNPTSAAIDADKSVVLDAVQKRDHTDHALTMPGTQIRNSSPEDARWINMVTGDGLNGATIDVAKVQQLVITLGLLATYGSALAATAVTKAGSITEFPLISGGMLALLGVSHAAYLGAKQFTKA